MGENGKDQKKQGFEEASTSVDLSEEIHGDFADFDNWVLMESCGEEDEDCQTSTSSHHQVESLMESSINEDDDSADSDSSSSSLELEEDDASSSLSSSNSCLSSSSSSSSPGPLYELSELMANLPIKRGLSKFYDGKSQSFSSLARAESLEDLAKRVVKVIPHHHDQRKTMKFSYSPKPVITKKPFKKASFLGIRNNSLLDV